MENKLSRLIQSFPCPIMKVTIVFLNFFYIFAVILDTFSTLYLASFTLNILFFVIISPWKKVGLFIWTKLSPHHPRLLSAKYSWNWPSGSEEGFLISPMYFRYFVIISPWKRAGPLIWTNLNRLPPRMFCVKFGFKPSAQVS